MGITASKLKPHEVLDHSASVGFPLHEPRDDISADYLRLKLQRDPVRFARDFLSVQLWTKQEEILNALRDHRRVAVKAGNGLGKGFTAAIAALWFAYSHKPATVLTTAPTARQVRHILWREIHRLHNGSPFDIGGQIFATRLELAHDSFALGLSTDDVDQFQGFHSPNMLIVVDEAEGVAEEIYEAIDAVMTAGSSKLLLIGNPTSDGGSFRRAFHEDRRLYHNITISALESPNVMQQRVQLPGLTTHEWVAERETLWGPASPMYRARVLGEFSDHAQDVLISLAHIEQAIARYKTAQLPPIIPTPSSVRPAPPSIIPAPSLVIPAQAGTHVTPDTHDGEDRIGHENAANIPAPPSLPSVRPTSSSVIPAQAGTHVTPDPHDGEDRIGHENADNTPTPPPSSVRPERSETATLPARPGSEGSSSHEVEGPPPPHNQPDDDDNAPTVLAVDVARYGSDKSVLLLASPSTVLRIQSYQNMDTMQLAGRVAHAYKHWFPKRIPRRIVVDEIGIGAGVVDRLKELNLPVTGINVARPARKRRQFINLRAEGYWRLRELLAEGLIAIPDDPELAGQLASIRHYYRSTGQLYIESKDDSKARGAQSPDKADALMLAYLNPRPSFKLYI